MLIHAYQRENDGVDFLIFLFIYSFLSQKKRK